MILYDFSSAIHRSMHTAIKHTNPHKENSKYKTDEFISVLIYRVISEFIEFYSKYKKEYGDFVICLDDHSKPYWRKSIYYNYKGNRKKNREESDINYDEVFKHLDVLTKTLREYTDFKVIGVPGVEADDIIGLLTRRYAKFEKVLILSPDKDFKQLHSLGQIRQYSSLTNSWVVPEDIEGWKLEHILCGDSADCVPRVVDFLNFTTEFKMFLDEFKYDLNESQWFDLPEPEKARIHGLAEDFDPDVHTHERPRFGMSIVKKYIKEFGSLDNWLDSNPILRKTFEMNRKLVIDDYVPPKIEAEILTEYTKLKNKVNLNKLKIYFDFYNLSVSCLPLFKNLHQSADNVVPWTTSVDFRNAIV